MKPTTDISSLESLVQKLFYEVATLKEENASLRSENLLLKQENELLRGRLNKNSQNSHKPPSTDGLRKKTSPALVREKKSKLGGQQGHKGNTLKMVSLDKVDEKVVHHASNCSCCSRAFQVEEVELIVQTRQVFDLPTPRLEITAHQLGIITCCGQAHIGTFPSEVTAPVQYGHRIKALVSLLHTDYRMPLDKISTLFDDLYEYNINDNTIIGATQKCYETLEEIENTIKEAVTQSEVAHFDETGMRVAAKLHWFHTACTTLFCYLFVHAKRGKVALEDAHSVLKDYMGWAVHDCWASYFDFSACKHVLCNAHILRELQALVENRSIWAGRMHAFLLELYQQSQKGTVILTNRDFWEEKFQQICTQADLEEPPPIKGARGKPKNSKGRNLLNRLCKHKEAILAFAFYESVPFTNNTAERDIRHVKVKQKVAMSFRTFHGAEIYARIQGFVITTRKQKQNTFKELCRILKGEKYTFKTT